MRRKLMCALWSAPSEGLVYTKLEVDLTNYNEWVKTLPQ